MKGKREDRQEEDMDEKQVSDGATERRCEAEVVRHSYLLCQME